MRPTQAAQDQAYSNGHDDELLLAAKRRHPKVRWWWGRRYRDRINGAWCYLCDCHVATWSRRWPITETARLQIAAHRTDHLQGRLDRPATQPEEE